MATLQKLRNRAGLLIAVIIGFALIAFILADFLGMGGPMGGGKNEYEVAEISGKSISLIELQNKIEYLSEIQKLYTGKTAMDDEGIERIQEQSWQQLVREHVLNEEYENLGISVNPEEVFDMVQGRNIHPFIQNLFADPNTGQINTANIIRFLKSMDQDPTGNQKAYWLFLEKEMITERMFTKYNNLVSKGLTVSNPYIEKTQEENNKVMNLEYIVSRFSSIPDSAVEVSESDIKAYYKKHKEDYKQEASRDIEYIIFNVVPSAEDDRASSKYINDIVEDFKTTEDDKDFVNLNSDVPFNDINLKNGELSELINDFMFSAKIGDIFGPYFENDAYKIAKLSEINYLPDSVKARHILIDAGKTEESAELAAASADSLKEVIINGADFAELATQYSIDGSAEKGGDLGWFKEGKMVKPFNDTCFEGNKGDIKVVRSQFGYHVVEILDQAKEVKKVKVAIIERKVEPSTQTYQFYYSKASKFGGKYNNYDLFSEGAEKEGLTKRTANDIKEFDKSIPGLESPRELIKWAYQADVHDISSIFEFGNQFVIAILTDKQEDGYAHIEEVRTLITNEVKKEKKAEKLINDINVNLSSANTITELANILKTEVKQASNVRFSSNSLPGAGFEPSVIATAYVLPENEVSKPIKGNNGIYIINVTSIETSPSGDIQLQKQRLSMILQQRANYEAYNTLEKLADVKDYRAKYY